MALSQSIDPNRKPTDSSFVFGVSGHRDLVPASLPDLRRSLESVFASFRAAYPGRPFEILSPLAEGADRLAAEIAVSHGIRLLVPMPMEQTEYERDFSNSDSLAEFRRLLATADRQWIVQRQKNDDPSSGAEAKSRAQRYANVGDFIARECHVLILLWDGKQNEKLGGTGWVKRRREYWVAVSDKGGDRLATPGYLETIQIVTPRLAGLKQGNDPVPVEIIGNLPRTE